MTVINLRISKADKEHLTKVAQAAGLSLSAFLRMAAVKEAYRVLGPPKLVRADQQETSK